MLRLAHPILEYNIHRTYYNILAGSYLRAQYHELVATSIHATGNSNFAPN